MATQYTSILKLALPVQGELSGTWGDVVNDDITSMVEEAIAGREVINSWTANSHTLTTADGTTSESRAAILTLTDTGTALTGAGTVICPTNSKVYIVENGTGQTITVKTSSGTGIAVPNTKNMVVFCDGTNVEEGITNINLHLMATALPFQASKTKTTWRLTAPQHLPLSSPSRRMLILKLLRLIHWLRFWLTATLLVELTLLFRR